MPFSFKYVKQLEQSIFWLFIWLFIFDYYFFESNWGEAIVNTTLEVLTYTAIVYLNLLVLIPFLLQKKRRIAFCFAMLAAISCYIFILRYSGMEKYFYEHESWRNVFSMVLNTSLFLLISTLYWYFKQGLLERERQLLLRSEKLEAELKYLRSQISPHFIFNALNNIYALIRLKHENAGPMVAKLASLLRNILYEGAGGFIALEKEINTVRQYIDLNLFRKLQSVNIDFYLEGNCNNWVIPPLLLVNFTENCFKHCNLDATEDAFIKINCEIGENGFFIFTTENSFQEKIFNSENSGIGLQNARQQLELNYPGVYSLEMHKDQDIFKIVLKMQLRMP